jgi:hypothetical protein
MKKIFLPIVFTLAFLFPIGVHAEEIEFFDSTDHYLGACQLTDKSEWELSQDSQVSKFEIWYSWNEGETTLPVKVFLNGEPFADFTATRGNCDTYQKQWCNADFEINKLFPKGVYTTEIPNARQCLKPGGTGTVRLYKDDTVGMTDATTPTQNPIIQPTPSVVSEQKSCSCSQTIIVVTAAATALITSLAVSLIFKKIA